MSADRHNYQTSCRDPADLQHRFVPRSSPHCFHDRLQNTGQRLQKGSNSRLRTREIRLEFHGCKIRRLESSSGYIRTIRIECADGGDICSEIPPIAAPANALMTPFYERLLSAAKKWSQWAALHSNHVPGNDSYGHVVRRSTPTFLKGPLASRYPAALHRPWTGCRVSSSLHCRGTGSFHGRPRRFSGTSVPSFHESRSSSEIPKRFQGGSRALLYQWVGIKELFVGYQRMLRKGSHDYG